jgi:molybdopterin biosynthesis enzyme
MKPGKPLTFATLQIDGSSRKLLVLGLPGERVRMLLLLW